MGTVEGLAIIPFMIGIVVLAAVAVVMLIGVLASLTYFWVRGIDAIVSGWRRLRGVC